MLISVNRILPVLFRKTKLALIVHLSNTLAQSLKLSYKFPSDMIQIEPILPD